MIDIRHPCVISPIWLIWYGSWCGLYPGLFWPSEFQIFGNRTANFLWNAKMTTIFQIFVLFLFLYIIFQRTLRKCQQWWLSYFCLIVRLINICMILSTDWSFTEKAESRDNSKSHSNSNVKANKNCCPFSSWCLNE